MLKFLARMWYPGAVIRIVDPQAPDVAFQASDCLETLLQGLLPTDDTVAATATITAANVSNLLASTRPGPDSNDCTVTTFCGCDVVGDGYEAFEIVLAALRERLDEQPGEGLTVTRSAR